MALVTQDMGTLPDRRNIFLFFFGGGVGVRSAEFYFFVSLFVLKSVFVFLPERCKFFIELRVLIFLCQLSALIIFFSKCVCIIDIHLLFLGEKVMHINNNEKHNINKARTDEEKKIL